MNPMLKRINHTGIIVEDIGAAITKFSRLGFSASPIRILEESGLKTAHLSMAGQDIELIAYLSEAPCFGRDVMGPQKGLNHIAFEVENLDKAIEWAGKMGQKLMKGVPTRGSKGNVAFFEPDENDGILIEFCETAKNGG